MGLIGGTTIGFLKGDARSLDNGLYKDHLDIVKVTCQDYCGIS